MGSHRTREGWQRIKLILDDALDVPAGERAVLIAARCEGDEELRREVESLAAAAEGWTFIDRPDTDELAAATSEDPRPPLTGDRIGAYELISELGSGGMGMVYLARRADDEFQKKVAIKL